MIEVVINKHTTNRKAVIEQLRGFGTVYERMIMEWIVMVDADPSEIPAMEKLKDVYAVRDGNEVMFNAGVVQEAYFGRNRGEEILLRAHSLNNLAVLQITPPDLDQWDIGHIRRSMNIDRVKSGAGVTIGIADSGLYHSSMDYGNRYTSRAFDGYPSDGYQDHGTKVASVAAGNVLGIAPGATLTDARVFDVNNAGAITITLNGWDALAAIHNSGSVNSILNYSGSANQATNPFGTAVQNVINTGMCFFTIAGNEGNDLAGTGNAWPGETANAFTVGGLNINRAVHPNSNFGSIVDVYVDYDRHIAAESVTRFSGPITGTSFAAPQASGIAALVLEGRAKMTTSAEVLAFYQELKDDFTEGGCFNQAGTPDASVRKLFYPSAAITTYQAAPDVKPVPQWTRAYPALYFDVDRCLKSLSPNVLFDKTNGESIFGMEDPSGNNWVFNTNTSGTRPTYNATEDAINLSAANTTVFSGNYTGNNEFGFVMAHFRADTSINATAVAMGGNSNVEGGRAYVGVNASGVAIAGLGEEGPTIWIDPLLRDLRSPTAFHTVALAWDNTTGRMYLDGELILTRPLLGKSTASFLRIGGLRSNTGTTTNYLIGSLKHAGASNKPLSGKVVKETHDLWTKVDLDMTGLIQLPDGIPMPVVWFSPEFVTLNADGVSADVLLNKGTGGSAYDATPFTGQKVLITNEASWNNRKVFDTSTGSTGGYVMGQALLGTKAFMTMSTYANGATTFGSFDAIVSGAGNDSTTEFEIVGNSFQARFFGKTDSIYIDGVKLATPTTNMLPMVKKTLAGQVNNGSKSAGKLFYDNFSTSRYWNGLTGEMMMWNVPLTDAQIASVHKAIAGHYS